MHLASSLWDARSHQSDDQRLVWRDIAPECFRGTLAGHQAITTAGWPLTWARQANVAVHVNDANGCWLTMARTRRLCAVTTTNIGCSRSSRKRKPKPGLPGLFDHPKYRQRNIIERMFGWLKENRRILTLFDKLTKSYTAMVSLPCAMRCMRRLFSGKSLGDRTGRLLCLPRGGPRSMRPRARCVREAMSVPVSKWESSTPLLGSSIGYRSGGRAATAIV
jgi:transposase